MTRENLNPIKAYTDGGCLGNPGPGGWAALIILQDGTEKIITGRDSGTTTNQRMELTAAIEALNALPVGASGTLHSDSEYVVKGITSWLPGWKQRGWKNSQKKPVANQDLWQRLDALHAERSITFGWVRGHNGHPENERVDTLANAEAAKAAEEAGWAEGFRYGFTPVEAG